MTVCPPALSLAGFPPLSDADVRRVRAPTLLLVGARSPAIMRLLSDRLHRRLPDSDLIEVPDASHLMHEDNADFVNAAILRFLGERREPPRS